MATGRLKNANGGTVAGDKPKGGDQRMKHVRQEHLGTAPTDGISREQGPTPEKCQDLGHGRSREDVIGKTISTRSSHLEEKWK
jgi:hypothetical protein